MIPLVIEILCDHIYHTAIESSVVVFACICQSCIVVTTENQLALAIDLDVYVLLMLRALVVLARLPRTLAFGHSMFLISSEESLIQTKIILITVLICSSCV